MSIPDVFSLAQQHHQAGRLPQAEQLYRQILAAEPNHAEALHYLGVIAHQVGKQSVALDFIQRSIGLNPHNANAYCNLGCVHRELSRFDESVTAFKQAIAIDADSFQARNNLANVLRRMGRVDEAIAELQMVVGLQPNYHEAFSNLGNALRDAGDLDGAIEAYHKAITLRPDFYEGHCNLGTAYLQNGQVDQAIASCKSAIALQPRIPEAYYNLAIAYKDQADFAGSLDAYRTALSLKPDQSYVHSNLIFTMLYAPGFDARSIANELTIWQQRFVTTIHFARHVNSREGKRRLRIGYVSPDFREHVVGRNILPLLREHHREQFEIFCYAHVAKPDATSDRLRSFTDHWQTIFLMNDHQAAEQIRADEIDILVDLSLHTAGNRLSIFARKPAPVQVTFAGYPGTTGLRTIDYRLSDPYLDPPESDETVYSEKTVRLPHTFWCYDYDAMDLTAAPDIDPPPAISRGFVTFGCLSNSIKVNEPVAAVWAAVMRVVAGSHLLLLVPPGQQRSRLHQLFSGHGIDPSRIQFADRCRRDKYLALYREIDIGLDTLPYNGHTTSLDSFWMGVPVVTLIGNTIVGRAGWSQLNNLGLAELAAKTEMEFVQIAAGLAAELSRLEKIRFSLRQRMRQSPLMDAVKFASDIETAYRQMWQTWCSQQQGTS